MLDAGTDFGCKWQAEQIKLKWVEATLNLNHGSFLSSAALLSSGLKRFLRKLKYWTTNESKLWFGRNTSISQNNVFHKILWHVTFASI